MATNGKLGYSTLLKRDTTGGGVYTTIEQVLSITGPAQKVDMKDVTSMDSSGGYREFIAGLIDAGEVKFDIVYNPTNTEQAAVLADVQTQNQASRNYQLVFPTAIGKTWTFAALVSDFSESFPLDDKIAASITLKITGKPTMA